MADNTPLTDEEIIARIKADPEFKRLVREVQEIQRRMNEERDHA